MKQKLKFGFTLAEVLVALAIIGVVAALTIPQLVKTINKDKAGSTLGKTVQQIELGCQNMIQAYNNRDNADASLADTLSSLDGDFSFSMEKLAPYIGAKATDDGYLLKGINSEIILEDDFIAKDGRYEMVVHNFIIDVNGAQQRPNSAGKDRFYFELRNDGKLIPEGLGSNTCDGDNPTIDENCTARVIHDGYKIRYNY